MAKLSQKTIINNNAKEAAIRICDKYCFSKYDNCPHIAELKNTIAMSYGNHVICPLEKYNIKFSNEKKDFIEQLRNQVSLIDCLYLCANCEHGKVNQSEWKNGYLVVDRTDEDFYEYCTNCPVHRTQEGIEECMAEAEMS